MSLDEQWKYELCYEREDYKMGPERTKYVREDIATMEPARTYLDVGCGRGEALEMAIERGLFPTGIETVPALVDDCRVFHGDVCDLPYRDNEFDYVSCYDVLEHLPPGEEQKALDELARVAALCVFISTNDKPSFLDGIDLHVNKRPQAAWHEDILLRWPTAIYEAKGLYGDWHWTCPA